MASVPPEDPTVSASPLANLSWGGARIEEAEVLVGSPEVFALMRRAQWVNPVVQVKRLTIFDRGHIQKAWNKLVRLGFDYLRSEANRVNPHRRVGVQPFGSFSSRQPSRQRPKPKRKDGPGGEGSGAC